MYIYIYIYFYFITKQYIYCILGNDYNTSKLTMFCQNELQFSKFCSCQCTVQFMNQQESVHTFWIFYSSLNARVAHIQYLHKCCLMPWFSRPELERGLDVSAVSVTQLIKPHWPSGFVGKICHTLTVARKTEFKLRPVGWNHISNPVKWIVILSITEKSFACGESHKSRPFLCLQSGKKCCTCQLLVF